MTLLYNATIVLPPLNRCNPPNHNTILSLGGTDDGDPDFLVFLAPDPEFLVFLAPDMTS